MAVAIKLAEMLKMFYLETHLLEEPVAPAAEAEAEVHLVEMAQQVLAVLAAAAALVMQATLLAELVTLFQTMETGVLAVAVAVAVEMAQTLVAEVVDTLAALAVKDLHRFHLQQPH
jgi:hypothetical protein